MAKHTQFVVAAQNGKLFLDWEATQILWNHYGGSEWDTDTEEWSDPRTVSKFVEDEAAALAILLDGELG
jgi:hypothetical protein